MLIFFGTRLTSQNVSLSGAVSGNTTYPDLASVFAAINASTQTGATISINITSSTTETTTATLNTGAWTSLVISPSGGAMSVSGNIAGPLIDLYGADHVKIDGLNSSGNALTISNSNAGGSTVSTIRFMVDATSNTITNCSILGSSTSSLSGVICFSVAVLNGNSNNIISNCNIGPVGSNLPTNGIYSIGNSAVNHSGNIVQNNNIYDFFNAIMPSSGVYLSTFNTTWSITGNKFYQTATRTFSSSSNGAYHDCLQIASGNSYSITSNVFGFSSFSSTGIYVVDASNGGGVSIPVNAIELSIGNSSVSSVQGNTVTSMQVLGYQLSSNFMLSGLHVFDGKITAGDVSPNIFGGSSGTNLLNAFSIAAIMAEYSSSSTGSLNVQNNTFGGITSNLGSNTGGFLSVMYVMAPNANISGNLIGSSTPSNIVCGHAVTANYNTHAYGIYAGSSSGNGTITVSSNTIQNIASYGFGSRSTVSGFNGGYGNCYKLSSNLVRNISLVAADRDDISSGFLPGAVGLFMDTGAENSATSNTITGISITGTANVGCYAAGIYCTNWTNGTVTANAISNITNSQGSSTFTAPSVATGILLFTGSYGTRVVNNNFVNLGAGNADNTIYTGIQSVNFYNSSSSLIERIYFNTINISGTASSGLLPTFGFLRGYFGTSSSSVTIDFRNNLITNSRSGTFSLHYALGNDYGASSTSTVGWSSGGSDYNILNTTNSLTVGYWGANLSLTGWQSASGCDANSYSGVNITYANPGTGDLHLNTGTTPSYAESRAIAISGYTTDIDGQTRPGPGGSVNGGGIAPDIGADEVDAVPYDVTPPAITFTNLSSACASISRTISAIISDFVGVPTTGSLIPRIYFRKNSNSYVSNQGSLTAGSTYSGTWSFTINFASMGSVSDGDVISYFICAQDRAATPNVTSSPSTGLVASDVNSVSTPPTVFSQTITVMLIPTISVNSGSICSGHSFTIIPSGANTYSINGSSFTVSPASTANYSITGTSNLGCISSSAAIANVTVFQTPTVSANGGTICSGNSFIINPSGAASYTITGATFTVSPLATSAYSITGTSTAGCISNSVTVVTVSVYNQPTITVSSATLCIGNTFVIVPSGAASYSISGGSFSVSPSITTSYSVTGTSSLGCPASNTAIVTISAIPKPTVSINSGSICLGTPFVIIPGGASTYTISGSSFTVSPTVSTSYSVTGTGTNGCVSSNTAVSTITVFTLPTLTVSSSNALVCAGETTSLIANGATSYSWTSVGTGSVISVTPTTTTTYSVTGTDLHGCNSMATVTQMVSACTGISSTEIQFIHVYPNPGAGIYTINLPASMNISIIDALGKIIYARQMDVGNHKIDLSDFNQGLYILKAESSGQSKIIRLIKE